MDALTAAPVLASVGFSLLDIIDIRSCIATRIRHMTEAQHPYEYFDAEIARLRALDERLSLAELMQ